MGEKWVSECGTVRFREGHAVAVGCDTTAFDVDVDVVVDGAQQAATDFERSKS